METSIIFLLLIVAGISCTIAAFYKGRNESFHDIMRVNERYISAAIGKNAAQLETAMLKKMTNKLVSVSVAYEVNKRSNRQQEETEDYLKQDFDWSINDFGSDADREIEDSQVANNRRLEITEQLPTFQPKTLENRTENAVFMVDNSLENRTENAVKTLPNRSENAPKTLLERTHPQNIGIGDKSRVWIKNPKEGTTFFRKNKIEKNPLTDVIHYYRKVEAGFQELQQIPIMELQKGKAYKVAHNNPLILLCGFDNCNNVTLVPPQAHNAKYCGCEDCTKF